MAQAITTTCAYTQMLPNAGVTQIFVETPATADTGDTIVITLTDHGIQAAGLLDIRGSVHTTTNSVIVAEAPTCAVSSGVLTITVGGSANTDKKRVYVVIGRSNAGV